MRLAATVHAPATRAWASAAVMAYLPSTVSWGWDGRRRARADCATQARSRVQSRTAPPPSRTVSASSYDRAPALRSSVVRWACQVGAALNSTSSPASITTPAARSPRGTPLSPSHAPVSRRSTSRPAWTRARLARTHGLSTAPVSRAQALAPASSPPIQPTGNSETRSWLSCEVISRQPPCSWPTSMSEGTRTSSR